MIKKQKLKTIEVMTFKEFKELNKKTSEYKKCKLSLEANYVYIERYRYE